MKKRSEKVGKVGKVGKIGKIGKGGKLLNKSCDFATLVPKKINSMMSDLRTGYHGKSCFICFFDNCIALDTICVCWMFQAFVQNWIEMHTFGDMNAFMWCKSAKKVIF